MKRNQYTSKVFPLLSWSFGSLMLWNYEHDTDDQAAIRASPRRVMDLVVLYVGVCFSCLRFQLLETFSIPIKPLKHTTNSTDEPKDTYLSTLITVIWVCSLVGQPGIPRNYVHTGCFCTRQFTFNANVQHQCRKQSTPYVARWKVTVWRLRWRMGVLHVWLLLRRREFAITDLQ